MLPVKLIVLLTLLSCGVATKTQLKPAVERVFGRRKRAIIFPPGSFVKFTLNFGKGLLSRYPRGISFNLEEAVYYPIPGTRDDLYPKRFRPKSTAKPARTPATTFVYIPGTDWRFKAQVVSKPKPRPLKTQRIDELSHANPYKWQKWSQYGAQWATTSRAYYKKKWTTPAPKWTAAWTQSYAKYKPTGNWRHYAAHRDRRDLFAHFAGLSELFGIDVKSCILRTICDAKRLLLPTGYSMLQDMLRLVFTLPRLDGLEDEYTRMMSQDADTCALHLNSKCNMNLLIWLLSGRLDHK
ncbi:uncharacterized protein LOC108601521 [Drosophila busckii]|uniref:uncharacterized protein LOC108601521 n=1 Tax=Drosophila busckii TaxID=30019 RepID=UPI00083EE732|nr:uncharacterized protein LOC108601521 [Drosophila busckii]